jgi:hypothetical protein
MKNKEQLLYFFLQGKISLSQYDYKFMANLQTMIQNNSRVTSNQADLFDKLISKYKKQLSKNGFVKEELKALTWKTLVVESTPEYTGATVSLYDNDLVIKVPFNKQFISAFRMINNNSFEWSKEFKYYTSPFSTNALKIAHTVLPNFFNTIRYSDELSSVIDELDKLKDFVWNPTLTNINGRPFVIASNSTLGELINNMDIKLDPKSLFKISQMHISIDPSLYENDKKLEFAAKQVYETDIVDLEKTIEWMKNLGCQHVVIGRGLRNILGNDTVTPMIEKYGMKSLGPMSFGKLPEGTTMLIQHTSSIDTRNSFSGKISKTIVLKDSRPIEVL